MGAFLESEKIRQARFKSTSTYLTEAARADGLYRGALRPFCLPNSYTDENLYERIRKSAVDYFAKYRIAWHRGVGGKPTNHLCSSQVCCLNFLLPFADKPRALVSLLRPLFPAIDTVLPMEGDPQQFVAFEWIGLENYLGEKTRTGAKRTRGANFTSADAAVMFQRTDGRRQIVLIEWKYTESYGGTPLHISHTGTSRVKIYCHLYENDHCPINKALLGKFGDLFYEPFYQLMRQQFLAWEMEQARELGADLVSVLHIAPSHNRDFNKVTSPDLQRLGDSAIEVWRRLVNPQDRFMSFSTESLFGDLPIDEFPELGDWWNYVSQRYPWIAVKG